jgi:putative colanic acid biosynthesis glycosyltransferase WcaI
VTRRLAFLTHYYPPEKGAPQTRLHETAQAMVASGNEVAIITGPPHYPDGTVFPGYRSWGPSRESIGGIRVVRLPMLARQNGGLIDRVIDQGSFAAAAMAAVPIVRWADIVVVESPPLFLALTAAFHDLVTRRPYLFHVADPWPDFPIAMGALRHPFAQRTAYLVETIGYRRARVVTTVTKGLVDLLDRKPSARGKVRLLPNGVTLGRFDASRDASAARAEMDWPEAALTVVYAGSIGLAQGVSTLIEAVAPLQEDGVVLHLVGDGYERLELEQSVRDRRLPHVHFHPAVSAARIPTVLAAADVLAVLLKKGLLFEHSLPTKLVEGLAAGRPIIASAAGEAADLVTSAGAGIAAPPEDPVALREAIVDMLRSSDRAGMGQRGRRLAEERFDRRRIVETLVGYLDEALKSPIRQ